MADQETFLTMQDVADRYGVALQTVRGWRVTGYGPKGFKIGRLVRYSLDEVLRFEQELMAEASA